MSRWVIVCTSCGERREGLEDCPNCSKLPDRAHAEKLQAAKDWVERCEDYLTERLCEKAALFAVPHINRYVDAKVELALLERGK